MIEPRRSPARTGQSLYLRIAGYALVVVLHICAIWGLSKSGVIASLRFDEPEQEITWLVLNQPPKRQPSLAVPEQPSAPQIKRLQRAPLPPVITLAPSAPGASADPKALTALRSYIWCGQLDDGKQLTDNAKPCNDVKWQLQTTAIPKRGPTFEEQVQERQFERQLAFDKAPKLIPCGGSLICIVEGALNGFDYHMGSYGYVGQPRCDLSAPQSEFCAKMYASRFQAPINWQR